MSARSQVDTTAELPLPTRLGDVGDVRGGAGGARGALMAMTLVETLRLPGGAGKHVSGNR